MRTLCALILLGSLSAAQDVGKPNQNKKEDARFARLKKLAGDWCHEDAKDKIALNYRVTSNGSAVVETMLPGTKMEMLTVYTMDGEDLKLTHYCALGNQPVLKAAKEIKDGSLAFQCEKVGNTKSHNEMHMHALVITFKDEDTFHTKWTSSAGGTDGGAEEFTYVRKK